MQEFLILIYSSIAIRDRLDCMTVEQLTRFEYFLRSHFTRSKIKEILAETIPSQHNISDDLAIVVGSLSKLFVGELVETGKPWRCVGLGEGDYV